MRMKKQDVQNIIKETLFNVLRDKINERENLVTEMWSYSDQMDKTIDYIYDILYQNISNSEMHKLDFGVGLKHGIIENLTLFKEQLFIK